jgi:hypothetical protein
MRCFEASAYSAGGTSGERAFSWGALFHARVRPQASCGRGWRKRGRERERERGREGEREGEGEGERERKREREGERERGREGERESTTDTDTATQTKAQARHSVAERRNSAKKRTGAERWRHTNTHKHRQPDTQTDPQTDTQTDTHFRAREEEQGHSGLVPSPHRLPLFKKPIWGFCTYRRYKSLDMCVRERERERECVCVCV